MSNGNRKRKIDQTPYCQYSLLVPPQGGPRNQAINVTRTEVVNQGASPQLCLVKKRIKLQLLQLLKIRAATLSLSSKIVKSHSIVANNKNQDRNGATKKHNENNQAKARKKRIAIRSACQKYTEKKLREAQQRHEKIRKLVQKVSQREKEVNFEKINSRNDKITYQNNHYYSV